jgi:hypothetical protein
MRSGGVATTGRPASSPPPALAQTIGLKVTEAVALTGSPGLLVRAIALSASAQRQVAVATTNTLPSNAGGNKT